MRPTFRWFAALLLATTTPAAAQFVPAAAGTPDATYRPVIGGIPVYCTAYGSGQPVLFVSNPWLNDIGRARSGAVPTIELNPVLLAQLPRALQLFWYGHECGHHVLGPMNSEVNADCWAIRTAKQQGLFTREDVLGFEAYFRHNPGSPWGHLPGPARWRQLVACWDAA